MTTPNSNKETSNLQSLPPIKLRDYQVTERIGSGSYGSVYKARKKTGVKEVVAVKCVMKSQLSKAETEHIINEIALLKRLKHNHIVSMIDFAWDAHYIYIIMEYCSGGDLSTFIKLRKKLSEDTCRRFLQQLASALKYLRSQDVAHMDLKPSNILLATVSSRPILKLADFGLSQHLKNDQEETSIRGSPLYMAPEMIMKRRYDAKVDLWSVGIILFECLFGRAPYKSSTLQECLQKVKEEKSIEIPVSAGISESCRDFLTGLLQRDPATRISFDAFFEHPFLDLEHMPSEESSAKALALAEEAVRKDRDGDFAGALDAYTKALEYFVPIIQYEVNSKKKETLRNKTIGYMRRAEELKRILNPSQASMEKTANTGLLQKRSSTENNKLEELLKLCSVTPKLETGVEIAKDAELYELEAQYVIALEKYQSALGLLLPLLKEEPPGRRKTLLGSEVTRWMKRAECVKQLLDTQESILNSNLADSVDKSLMDKQCSIQ